MPTITPEDFKADPTGATDSTTELNLFAATLGDGVNGRMDGDYLISERIILSNKSNFELRGRGTVTVADGTALGETYAALLVQSCTDFLIEGLTIDANRDNRSPVVSGNASSCIRVIGNQRGVFRNIRTINGTWDGFYLRASAVATESTYPTDLLFDNCSADNCYRNGMSVIGSKNCTVRGGKFTGSVGASPQAGLGIEPNSNDDFGNQNLRILDVECSDNTEFGHYWGSNHITAPNNGESRVSGSGNGDGLVRLSRCDGVKLIARVGAHSGTPPEGLIDVTGFARNVTIDAEFYDDITCTDSGSYCAAVANGAEEVRIERLICKVPHSIPTLLFNASSGSIGVVESDDCSASLAAVLILSSVANLQVGSLIVRRSTGYGLYLDAPRCQIQSYYIEDAASTISSIRVVSSATNAILRNGTIRHTPEPGTPPVGSRGIRFDVAPKEVTSLYAPEFSNSTLFTGSGTSFENTVLGAISPNPLSITGVINPDSVPAQGTITATVPMTYARTGDKVFVQPHFDLEGLQVSAYVSASGTVTYRLTNPTASAIDLSSGTWTFSLVKG